MVITVKPQIKVNNKWVSDTDSLIEFGMDNSSRLLDWIHYDYEKMLSLPASQKFEYLFRDPFNEFYEIRLSLSCNNFCTHCFIADRKKEEYKTFEQIRQIIDNVPTYWIIGLTGGEPTIREDFIDILKYTKWQKKIPYVQTNGRRFSDLNFSKEVSKYMLGTLIAIHSNNPEIHDVITKVKGSFEETRQGIINIYKENKSFVNTQTVIVRKNYNHLLDIAEMIQEIAPNARMHFTFPHPISGAFSKEVTPSLEEVRPHLNELLKKWGDLIHTHYIPKCYLHPYEDKIFELDIYESGMVIKKGIDILKGDLIEVDYGDLEKGSRVKKTDCFKCKYYNNCLGVWKEYTELYGLKVFPVL